MIMASVPEWADALATLCDAARRRLSGVSAASGGLAHFGASAPGAATHWQASANREHEGALIYHGHALIGRAIPHRPTSAA
jgi:hypothetical protein